MKLLKNNHESKKYYMRHLVPVAVWFAVIVVVLWLFHVRSQRFEVIGIARGQIREVSSDSTSRIKEIPVELFQTVKAGTTVAVVDTLVASDRIREAELKTELAAARAEVEHLASQLVPTQETLLAEAADQEITRDNSSRRFAVDVESTRAKVIELRAAIAFDQVALADYAADLQGNRDLLEGKVIKQVELDRSKGRYDALASKIEENRKLLEQAQADLKQAEARRDEFNQRQLKHPSVDAAMEVIRKEIAVQEELINGLVQQFEALQGRRKVELTAPIDGVIVPVQTAGRSGEVLAQRPGEGVIRRPGEVVTAGDPILAVAEGAPTEIVAYVGEQMLGRMREGTPVDLIKTRTRPQMAKATVSRLGRTIELMPQRLWRSPTVPQWGLQIIINIPNGLELLPGETVGVRGL
jgi:multidrug resistance efflux pump